MSTVGSRWVVDQEKVVASSARQAVDLHALGRAETANETIAPSSVSRSVAHSRAS